MTSLLPSMEQKPRPEDRMEGKDDPRVSGADKSLLPNLVLAKLLLLVHLATILELI